MFLKSLLLCAVYITRAVASSGSDLLVKTDLFSVQGVVGNTSNVRVFRGIPYAEPPVGAGRFMPPVTKKPEVDVVNATDFGAACIQLNTGAPTVYSQYLQGFLLTPGEQQSEDCLTLNIWAPRAQPNQSLPVMIYIPGGAFTSGGSASPYKYGENIVRDHQDMIVVSMNYRVNIFGFPNAAALDGRNLNPGFLDQRKAVEWLYYNIAAFGGDPSRMVLWGQSAGAASVDKYAYAWNTDPLVRGFILDSGTADGFALGGQSVTNFTYVAEQVNCTQQDADTILKCMQNADANAIISVLDNYNATAHGGVSVSFGPVADNETSFSNYTNRRRRGLFAQLPVLLGTNNNEFATLITYIPSGPNETIVQELTQSQFICPAAIAAQARVDWKVPVWRYRYFGTFPNLNPLPWLGAYHSSELPLVFGTANLRGPNTLLENKTSHYMQGAWVAFAENPARGLINAYSWPIYNATGETLIELGYEGNASAVFAKGDAFDQTCVGLI